MISDEQLMNAYKAGNEGAFNKLYDKYSPMVYGYIRKRLHPSETEDFYQSVWRHLHEKRDCYQNQPFAPWLFVLIKNLLVDEYRSSSRKKKLLEHSLPSEMNEDTQSIEEINEILKNLPDETATLIRKYYLEGFSYEDLEIETGMSQNSLRKRLSRALQGLKDKFEV